MKKYLVILFFSLVSIHSFAQEEKRKVLKINLSAAALGAATVQYERVLGKRFSLALGAGYRPKSLFPYAKDLEKYVDFADGKIDYISFDNVKKAESKIGMYHITPEMRFYFGRKQAPIGTYLSLFAKYNDFKGDVPVFVDTDYKGVPVRLELPVDTQIKTASAGLMVGHQFRLGNRFTFDCYVIGTHFGRVSVHGESNQNLEGFDDDFRTRLRDKILATFKINENYLGLVVDNQGVRIDNVRQLNYLNLRGFGFNLGYRF
ncbi:MAG: DUF3575 domain-containing protein [Emticicia sp.]